MGAHVGKRITMLWAFISDEEGDGIISAGPVLVGGVPQHMPLVGADEARMRSLEPMAQRIATATGKRIELVRFTTREHIRSIEP